MIASFPPVAADDARILILGSIPGRESLRQQQYYAHPRNAFWPIMAEIFQAPPDLPYPARLELLLANQIALWDVIGTCSRATSLDSDIEAATVQVNDFRRFLADHRQIATILCNGGTAENTFRKKILPAIHLTLPHLTLLRLPSTSPANAGCPYADKLAAWRVALLG